jgi:hypothetical protein
MLNVKVEYQEGLFRAQAMYNTNVWRNCVRREITRDSGPLLGFDLSRTNQILPKPPSSPSTQLFVWSRLSTPGT